HQSAVADDEVKLIHRGNALLRRELDDSLTIQTREHVRHEEQRPPGRRRVIAENAFDLVVAERHAWIAPMVVASTQGGADQVEELRLRDGDRSGLPHEERPGWEAYVGRSTRPSLPLQLLLEFLEKTPFGALGDEFLRRRLNHPRLVEPE